MGLAEIQMGTDTSTVQFKVEPRGPHFDKLLRWLAVHRSVQTLLSYPNTEGDYNVNLTGTDLERITGYAAAKYSETFQKLPNGEISGGVGFQGLGTKVVALVSASTMASYLTFLALQRLGLSPMFLSPRLAEGGYTHLLRTTECHTVLAAGPSLDTMRSIKRAYDGPLDVLPMLDDNEFLAGLAAPKVELREPVCTPGLILHTGGTTGLPKPVAVNITNCLTGLSARSPVPGPLLCTVPVFHLYGLGSFMICLLAGIHLCLLNPHRPVTASVIWRALDANRVRTLFTVPYTLKFFAEIEGGVERLAALAVVRSGGAAMPDDLGDLLIRKSVRLVNGYGQTEAGSVLAPYGLRLGEWNWLTPTPSSEKFVKFEKVYVLATNQPILQSSPVHMYCQNVNECLGSADDMYHLVVLPGWRSLAVSDRPDGSYESKDLFRPHPDNLPGNDTRPGQARWKFVARQGDIVVLANGENADPSPIEQAVTLDPHVEMTIAFSAGHERLGLLVIPSEKAAGMSRDEVVQAILPSLAHGNSLVSDYAKISPDDIVVKPVGTPYPLTAKMTLQRQILTKLFADDIEALCAARGTANAKAITSDDEIYDVVKRAVLDQFRDEVLGPSAAEANGQFRIMAEGTIHDDADFFSLGMDSLKSSLVRRRLQREIMFPDGITLATNVVFEYPTVTLLSEHIKSLRQGEVDENGSLARDPEAIATAMVKKYSTWGTTASGQVDFVTAGSPRGKNGASGQVIVSHSQQVESIRRSSIANQRDCSLQVLTGATGYIGSQILNTILNRPEVSVVYCLVRTRQPQDHDNATQRIHDALDNSQLLDGLSPKARAKLTCLSADLAAADLGLSPAAYGEIKASVTAIIHNAWTVNFNWRLESFESNVASVCHLLNLGCPVSDTPGKKKKPTPAFVFISSVAAVGAALRQGQPAEERMYQWREAMPLNGYGQSKWVAEQICASAATSAPRGWYRGPVRILRVAQVSGDTSHGIWNPAEAIPALVRSALTIGVLPRMEAPQRNTLCWLPSDAAGAAIVDLTLLGNASLPCENLAVYHVASPHTLKWNEAVLPAASKAGLPFRAVPQHEWVQILCESDKDVDKNPPYKLVEHFRRAYGPREDKNGTDHGSAGGSQNGKGEEMAHSNSLDLEQSLKYSSSLKTAPAVDKELLVKYIKFWLRCWGAENKSP